jgi:hypothetical protein
VVAGVGDALNTQDNVRRDDAEHNDLSHVHNLTRLRISPVFSLGYEGRAVCLT